MEEFKVNGQCYTIKQAVADDVQATADLLADDVLDLLADDVLGAARESDEPAKYESAFREIDADPNQSLAAIRQDCGAIVGTIS